MKQITLLVIAFFLFVPCISAENPDTGLVGYWKFDEASGKVAVDSSGNGNNGAINGAKRVTGVSGKALRFNGIDNSVEVPYSSSMLFGETSSFSVFAWIKTNQLTDDNHLAIVCRYTNVDGYFTWFMRLQTDGSLWVYIVKQNVPPAWGVPLPSVKVTTGTYCYVGFTYDGQTAIGYVNGIPGAPSTTRPFSGSVLDTNSKTLIGRNDTIPKNDCFNGEIDEVKIYNYARSPEQVEQEAKSIKLTGTINSSRVRVRTKPMTSNSDIIDYAANGEKVVILEKTKVTDTVGNMEDYWYKVKLKNGTEGWVFGYYIKK